MMDFKVSRYIIPEQWNNISKLIVDGFNFLLVDPNSTDREDSLELIRQFKGMNFEKFEVEPKQPTMYKETHFYSLYRSIDYTINYEAVLRVRKYNYREDYECHLSLATIETSEEIIHLELHCLDLPINIG